MTGRRAADQEFVPRPPLDNGGIELGRVLEFVQAGGGENLPGDVIGSTANDGNTLVAVQLLRGAPGDGPKLLCRLSSHDADLPDVGAQVLVAIPAGFSRVPGAPVILATPAPVPRGLPPKKPNERVLLGPKDNFVRLHADGTISLYTKDDTEDGHSVSLQVHSKGFALEHPHVSCQLDETGFHVAHSSGASIDLGSIGGVPDPFSSLASYCTLSAAMVELDAATVALGPEAGEGEPLAKALALQIVLAAISVALVDISAALTALGNGGAGAAVDAAVAAIELGAEAVPSSSAMAT